MRHVKSHYQYPYAYQATSGLQTMLQTRPGHCALPEQNPGPPFLTLKRLTLACLQKSLLNKCPSFNYKIFSTLFAKVNHFYGEVAKGEPAD